MTVTLNQFEKAELVWGYARRYGVLVETGLWNGGGVSTQLQARGLQCFAIDLDPANVRAARKWDVRAFCGDSSELLRSLLQLTFLQRPACFWLDAHFVAGLDEPAAWERHPCPLLDELAAIQGWPYAAASTVLVDDMRLLGSPGWPSRAGLDFALGNGWQAAEEADVLRLTPR